MEDLILPSWFSAVHFVYIKQRIVVFTHVFSGWTGLTFDNIPCLQTEPPDLGWSYIDIIFARLIGAIASALSLTNESVSGFVAWTWHYFQYSLCLFYAITALR